jgi:hypothetical protein
MAAATDKERRVQRRLRRRRRRRDNQVKDWRRTKERRHARAARREAAAVRKLKRLLSKELREQARKAPQVMFDDVTVSLIPADAPAVLVYVNGDYVTIHEVRRRCPQARLLPTDVNGSAPHLARCLDVERGDAKPADCPRWFREHAVHRPHEIPVFYGSISTTIPQIVAALKAAGIKRNRYLLLAAHYNFAKHICGPKTCGYPTRCDGCQWTDIALGQSLDESFVEDYFFA